MPFRKLASKLPDSLIQSHRLPWFSLSAGLLGAVLLSGRVPSNQTYAMEYQRPFPVAQESNDSDANEVSPAQLEKYVAVYKAMQRDRSLNVDSAAAANGMTLDAFRALESRVQHDEAALQRAREELQTAVKQPRPTASP